VLLHVEELCRTTTVQAHFAYDLYYDLYPERDVPDTLLYNFVLIINASRRRR
jgi:hypothetical protein